MIYKKLIIAISGASGAIYGIKLLKALQKTDIETHLVISNPAKITISQETEYSIADVQNLADVNHSIDNIAASISSGSFRTDGMIIAPCSVKTLSEISTGVTSTLISRAADVMLKERRKLVLMVRETPFHTVHLRHMVTLSEMGAIIAPPLPAFYNKPESINDIIDHNTSRILDLFDIKTEYAKRWQGI